MILLKHPRLLLAGAALIGLIVFAYMYKAELLKGADNAWKAVASQAVIATNEQSKKDSDNVRKEEQSLDTPALDAGLCGLNGLVREHKGCDRY